MPRSTAQPLPPFEFVVERHGPAVLRFCIARAGASRAEDCFQEAMLSALRAYDTVRDPAAIESWLFSIAARKVIDDHRGRARLPEPVDNIEVAAEAGQSPEAAAERMLATAFNDGELNGQVRALPQKQRFAVTLRFVSDLSHREIAEVMETSEAAARRNVFEGLKKLRADLTPQPHAAS